MGISLDIVNATAFAEQVGIGLGLYFRPVLLATDAYAILPSVDFVWLHYNSRKITNSAIYSLANSFFYSSRFCSVVVSERGR